MEWRWIQVDMGYSDRVKNSVSYILKRLGSTITYKRIQTVGEWSPIGITDIYWECASIKSVVYDVAVKDVEDSGGRLSLEDKAFAFLDSAFTDHSCNEYIKFTAGSKEFMAGELITGETDGATANVVSWYEDSGSYSDGDAVGVVWVCGVSGTFNASEGITGSVSGSGMATTTAINVSGGDDSVAPRVGDKIVHGGIEYQIASSGKDSKKVVRRDVTENTITVFARVENV